VTILLNSNFKSFGSCNLMKHPISRGTGSFMKIVQFDSAPILALKGLIIMFFWPSLLSSMSADENLVASRERSSLTSIGLGNLSKSYEMILNPFHLIG
jgi:hypothetical protein